MQHTKKNSIKDKSMSSTGTIPITAADLDKKPTRVRKKTKAAPEENTGDSKYKRPKVSKLGRNYKQNSKLKTQNSAKLPWKRKDWQQPESEYTFGAPPKNEKIIKQRRSASQMFLNRESFGEQGELMLEAMGASLKGRSDYDFTQGFHPYPGRIHPDLPKILLKQFPEGSTVFDPFMGGGTVLLEKIKLRNIWPDLLCFIKTTLFIQNRLDRLYSSNSMDTTIWQILQLLEILFGSFGRGSYFGHREVPPSSRVVRKNGIRSSVSL